MRQGSVSIDAMHFSIGPWRWAELFFAQRVGTTRSDLSSVARRVSRRVGRLDVFPLRRTRTLSPRLCRYNDPWGSAPALLAHHLNFVLVCLAALDGTGRVGSRPLALGKLDGPTMRRQVDSIGYSPSWHRVTAGFGIRPSGGRFALSVWQSQVELDSTVSYRTLLHDLSPVTRIVAVGVTSGDFLAYVISCS